MDPSLGIGACPLSPTLLIPLLIWSVIWKSIALWKAARRDQLVWYIALLILNTVGILPIIYIFAVAPRRPELGATTPTPLAET